MDLEMRNVNELRILAMDMIENAGSGHPGIALGSAPILYSLFSNHLNVVPEDDKNILRDRFILSAGHGSGILYPMLYAFGYNVSIEDLKNFRKLRSKTPGHPEYGIVPGVDATTGPLGQGISMAVGMAIAERYMAKRFNKPDLTLFDNYTYTLCGEGCLMEGVSYEALSLAGTLKLNKLIVLYDCNNVTLDGTIKGVMEQNILSYMKSLNFNTIEVSDGNDIKQISNAIALAKSSKDKPSFIKINTHIGFGSGLQDSNRCHGSLLGGEEVGLLRQKFGINTKPFELSKDVQRDLLFIRKRFNNIKKQFKDKMSSYSKFYPGDYKLLKSFVNGDIVDVSRVLCELNIDPSKSGREMGGIILNEIAVYQKNIICGTADLSSSTKVKIGEGYFNDDYSKKNIKYGVREFAMSSISNGIALYGGIIPVDSTFMVFSDYMKASLRLRAIMKNRAISIFTHDSLAVGQDGTTHQPCEQLFALRDIPNMLVFRPANVVEHKASLTLAINYDGPSSIVLTRQKLKDFSCNIEDAYMGGYIVSKEEKTQIDAIIIATGSEVEMALGVKDLLKIKGLSIRVVSMPCMEIFEMQSEKYKKSIIPDSIKSIFSIEAGTTRGWYKYTGKFGKCYGIDEFGESALPEDLFKKFNFTKDYIAKDIISICKKNK